ALHEILHRIRGDQTCVVACRVGRRKCIAVNQNGEARAEDRTPASRANAIPVEAVGDHIAFAVIALFPTARKLSQNIKPSRRNSAIRYTCRSASRNSSSREDSIL